jgi:squalene synthase HpnC
MSVTVESPQVRLPRSDEVMGQAAGENFPVASLVLGRAARRHVLAVYGFARLVDDTGDEACGDRAILLDELEAELSRVYGSGEPQHQVMRALKRTVAQSDLPEEPFRRLIEANRLDQVKTRYTTFPELLSYCRLSAAPVGELVLHIFGAATPRCVELSNHVCAALQVIEHLQDVGEDYARGRIYLPQDALRRCGCEERQLAAAAAPPELRAVVALLGGRCRELLSAGAPLVRQLPFPPRIAVAGFIAGGWATLRAIERSDFDVLATHPHRTRSDFCIALCRALAGR